MQINKQIQPMGMRGRPALWLPLLLLLVAAAAAAAPGSTVAAQSASWIDAEDHHPLEDDADGGFGFVPPQPADSSAPREHPSGGGMLNHYGNDFAAAEARMAADERQRQNAAADENA